MAAKFNEYKDSIDKALHDTQKPWTGWLALAEEKTGIKRLYLFLGILGFLAIYLLFGYAAQLLCNTIGFLYPAYCSMKAIESPQTGDDTKWLTYWTVYALLSIVEYPSDLLLHWFPFYWLVKAIFFTYCFWPTENNGSILLYEKVIRPRFLKHQGDVDNAFSNIAGAEEQKTDSLTSESVPISTTGSRSFGNNIPFALVFLAISVVLGAFVFKDSTNTIFEELKAKFLYSDKSFAVNVHEETPEDIKFEKEIFKLEKTYSKQEEKVWLTLLAGIKSVMKSNPHQPSVFLLLYEDDYGGRTAKCLAQDVSSHATKYLMRWAKKPVIIPGIKLKNSRLLEDPGLLLVDYNNAVRDRGAMIVTELQDVPPKVATSFHFFCDKYSPLVEKAIYFFTLKVEQLTSWQIQEKAENRLKELWSHEMADHFLQPLITRMTPNILKIASDSSNC